ncbi:MAG: hypothetical protein KBA92_06760, partial [Anaerolineaceae bacterium]|nr:hypothetical protein [Anaerolineaceae bacterium]
APTRTPLPSPTPTATAAAGVWEQISGARPLWLIAAAALLAGAVGLLLSAEHKRKAAGKDQAGEPKEEASDRHSRDG